VKRYADEEHSQLVRAVDAVVVSDLAVVEVVAAIWKKARMGELDEPRAWVLVRRSRRELTGSHALRVTAIPVVPTIVAQAATLTGRHGLRAYDAVQLASATAAQQMAAGSFSLLCFDAGLRAAAIREGLTVSPALT